MVVKDLNRWFKEKWVDVSRKDKDGKHPPCGRKEAKTSSKGYPKCRPSVKVSSKTPKTSGSMSEGQKRAATKRKRAKKQGVGGKPTVVKADRIVTGEPMDIAFRLLKEESRGQLTNLDLFDGLLDEGDLMHYDEMNDKQRAIMDAKMALPAHLFSEGSEMGENMNYYLFSRSMHDKIPEYHYDDELEYLRHFNDAMQPFVNNHENTLEILNNGDEAHPEHPHNVAMSRMHPDFENRMNTIYRLYKASGPVDIAFQLLKNPVSPEAKRHKLEYDKKYESTPERVKYRSELRRERRHRGIDGKGGPDMSHTKDHTLVAEDPHTNRARHFKERGTLKSDAVLVVTRL